jgi:hypothetical protein
VKSRTIVIKSTANARKHVSVIAHTQSLINSLSLSPSLTLEVAKVVLEVRKREHGLV